MDNIELTTKLKMSFSSVKVLSHDRGWKMLRDVEENLKIVRKTILFHEESILLLELAYLETNFEFNFLLFLQSEKIKCNRK